MKKNNRIRLSVNSELVRTLACPQLSKVAGGARNLSYATCDSGCPGCFTDPPSDCLCP